MALLTEDDDERWRTRASVVDVLVVSVGLGSLNYVRRMRVGEAVQNMQTRERRMARTHREWRRTAMNCGSSRGRCGRCGAPATMNRCQGCAQCLGGISGTNKRGSGPRGSPVLQMNGDGRRQFRTAERQSGAEVLSEEARQRRRARAVKGEG